MPLRYVVPRTPHRGRFYFFTPLSLALITMFATIINDCTDDNARGRQESRLQSLTETPTNFIGVASDIEASGHLVDVLDATAGRPGIVLVNVAPRGDHAKKWENGTPFGYFWFDQTLVVASVDGLVLAGIKKFGFCEEIHLLDTHTGAAAMRDANFITPDEAERIPQTQFRSFDFTPRIGAFIFSSGTVPSEPYPLEQVPELPLAIWHIDNFGNCKSTLTATDLQGQSEVETRYGVLPYVPQLRDVPDGHHAITAGSSGFRDTRFLEFIVQRQSFARAHTVKIGDDVFTDQSYFVTATE